MTERLLQQTADRVGRETAEHARQETIDIIVGITRARFKKNVPG